MGCSCASPVAWLAVAVRWEALLLLLLLLLTCLTGSAGAPLRGIGTPLAADFFRAAAVAYYSAEGANNSVLYDPVAGGCEGWGDECDAVGDPALGFVAVVAGRPPRPARPGLLPLPVLVGAVAAAFHLPGCAVDLRLTVDVLAGVQAGRVTRWTDPALLALNPGLAACPDLVNASIAVITPDAASSTAQVYREALTSQGFDPADVSLFPNNLTAATDADALRLLAATPHSLALLALPAALASGRPLARLLVGPTAVAPSLGSVARAADRRVAADGAVANASTAALDGGWPLVAPLWVVLRNNVEASDCEGLQAVVAFCRWLWQSDAAAALALRSGLAPLPYDARHRLATWLGQAAICNGTALPQPAPAAPLLVRGPPVVAALGHSVVDVFNALQADPRLAFTVDEAPTAPLALQLAALPPAAATFVLGAVRLVVLTAYNLTLDMATLCAILDGAVQDWHHPNITGLNPGGVVGGDGKAATEAITLLRGPAYPAGLLADLLRPACPAYTGAAWDGAAAYASAAALWAALGRNTAAITLVPWPTRLPAGLQAATLKVSPSSSLPPVAPSPSAYPLEVGLYLTVTPSLCAAPADDASRVEAFVTWFLSPAVLTPLALQFGAAAAPPPPATAAQLAALSCGAPPTPSPGPTAPAAGTSSVVLALIVAVAVLASLLTLSVLMLLRARRTRVQQAPDVVVAEECCEAIARLDLDAVAWLENLPDPDRIQAAFIRIVQVLRRVKPFIPDQLLMALHVGDHRSLTPPPAEAGGAGACESPAAVPVSPRARSYTQRGASAATLPGIVRTTSTGTVASVHPRPLLPLPAVPIRTVEEGSRSSSGSPGSVVASPASHFPAPPTLSRFLTALGSSRKSSHASSSDSLRTRTVSHSTLTHKSSSHGRLLPGPPGPATPPAPGLHRVSSGHMAGWEHRSFTEVTRRFSEGPLNDEWLTRRCAYMVVHFGCGMEVEAEPQTVLQNMRTVVAMVIRVAKANKATVDHVTLHSVALLWGMGSAGTCAALHAVTAALDVQREAEAPALIDPAVRPAFWLHVSVGCGLCVCTTVSSANHRFFVVDGPEVALAHRIGQSGLARQLKCGVLVSQAVRQEVHCAVQSFPRALLDGVLLWEPVRLFNTDEADNTEWMYQLDLLLADGHWTGDRLRDVFLMAQRGAGHSAVAAAAEELKAQYEALMSPQDLASLALLLATLPPEPPSPPLPPPPSALVRAASAASLSPQAPSAQAAAETDCSDAEPDQPMAPRRPRRKGRARVPAPPTVECADSGGGSI
eukprot:EG_transcript_416